MRAVEILKKLVEIPSPSGKEKRICDFVSNWLEERGYSVERQHLEGQERYNIFAKKGKPKVCFFGHLDTVEPVEGWTKDPYKLTIEGGKAYGLGTWDMKGGIAVIMALAEEKDIAILFTVDEEEISEGGWKAVENKEFFRDIELIISAEAGNTPEKNGGLPVVGIGRYGRVVVEVEKYLGGGHGAIASDSWLDWLCSIRDKMRNPQLKMRIEDIRLIKKGLSNPEKIAMKLSLLIHPEQREWEKELKIFDRWEIAKRKTPYLMPYLTKREEIEEVLNLIESPELVIGHSPGDENALAALGIPILIAGTRGENEHAADEWVDLKSMEALLEFYRKVCERKKAR